MVTIEQAAFALQLSVHAVSLIPGSVLPCVRLANGELLYKACDVVDYAKQYNFNECFTSSITILFEFFNEKGRSGVTTMQRIGKLLNTGNALVFIGPKGSEKVTIAQAYLTLYRDFNPKQAVCGVTLKELDSIRSFEDVFVEAKPVTIAVHTGKTVKELRKKVRKALRGVYKEDLLDCAFTHAVIFEPKSVRVECISKHVCSITGRACEHCAPVFCCSRVVSSVRKYN